MYDAVRKERLPKTRQVESDASAAFDLETRSRLAPQNQQQQMFSQSSAFHTPDNATDRIRSPLSHSTSQTSLHGSFSVGGMASSTGAHHPHGASSWASNSQSSTLSNSLNDPFLQSRSSYQSGYLMVRPFHRPNVCLVHFCLSPVNVTK